MQSANLFQQYKTQTLETLTNGEIVVKLFEEASKQIHIGVFSLGNNNSFQAYNAISKAQRVIFTLNTSLDMNVPISSELRQLYNFMEQQLIKANGDRDINLLKDILGLVDELKVSFREAEKLARMQK